jgi:hypothetical protein
MTYSKQTWVDNDTTKPVSAARLNHIEAGIASAAAPEAALAVGEATLPRSSFFNFSSAVTSLVSGRFCGTQFVADKTEQITQLRVQGSTAAGATPTLVRLGVYSVDANNLHTLVASTPNDTALLATAQTAYTKALSAPWSKVAGERYCIGIIVVTAAAAPSVTGLYPWSELASAPAIGSRANGLTDLPASFTPGDPTPGAPYIVALP